MIKEIGQVAETGESWDCGGGWANAGNTSAVYF